MGGEGGWRNWCYKGEVDQAGFGSGCHLSYVARRELDAEAMPLF